MVRFAAVLAFTFIVWRPKGSLSGLSQVHIKFRTLQESVSKLKTSLESRDERLERTESLHVMDQESFKKKILEDFEKKLGETKNYLIILENKLESIQIKMDNQLTAIQLVKLNKGLPNKYYRCKKNVHFMNKHVCENNNPNPPAISHSAPSHDPSPFRVV